MYTIQLLSSGTRVEGRDAGSLRIAGAWDEAADKLSAYIRQSAEGSDRFNLRASYNPGAGTVDIRSAFDRFDLALLSPFIPGPVDRLNGTLDGKAGIGGRLDSLIVHSDGTRLHSASMHVAYTNVTYIFDGPFHLSPEGDQFLPRQ